MGNEGDEDELVLSCMQMTMCSAIGEDGDVTCFDGDFFIFIRILTAALNQIIRFIVADMLMNRNGTAWLQRNLGKHLDSLAECLRIHDGITDDASRHGVFLYGSCKRMIDGHRAFLLFGIL